MSFSTTIQGSGTFATVITSGGCTWNLDSISLPATFTAGVATLGPKGDTGDTGVVAAISPLSYDPFTKTISADLSAYETLAHAAATYYPIPTGNTAQYIRGDGSIVNFPTVFTANKMTATVYNQTGTTLTKGQVVYINGAHGNLPTVALAQANGEATSAGTYGFVSADIGNNSSGTIVIAGVAENLNTNALADGDKLYLSPTVAGGYTTTKPAAPNHMVYLGVVTRAHPTLGTIQLRIQNGFELAELHDCAVPTPADKDLLVYESSTSLWKNKSFSTLDLLTGTAAASTYYLASNPSGYITSSALSGYATQSWVTGQGYITSSALSPYLTSATASATYYPIPTGTTAQYLRGDGTASTFATDVIASVPSASTTVAGKVELATDAEAIAGASTTMAVTPSNVFWNRATPGMGMLAGASTVGLTSGTGAATNASMFGFTVVGPDAGFVGYGTRRFQINNGQIGSINQQNGIINFDERVVLAFRLLPYLVSSGSPSADSVINVNYGTVLGADNGGNLARKGFGIQIYGHNNPMRLTVHDGTTYRTIDSSFTPVSTTTGVAFDIVLVSQAGTVTLYQRTTRNGGWSQIATSNNGPTGLSAVLAGCVDFSARSESTAVTSTRWRMFGGFTTIEY